MSLLSYVALRRPVTNTHHTENNKLLILRFFSWVESDKVEMWGRGQCKEFREGFSTQIKRVLIFDRCAVVPADVKYDWE